MDKRETLLSPYGEFMDLIACDAIYKGQAEQKRPKKKLKFEDFIALK